MAPENFVNSPLIKQQYLDYLAAEICDVADDDNMVEDYHPEDFYDWALEPCLPLFEASAPAPKQHLKITLHDYLNPKSFYYSLHTVDGKLAPVQREQGGVGCWPQVSRWMIQHSLQHGHYSYRQILKSALQLRKMPFSLRLKKVSLTIKKLQCHIWRVSCICATYPFCRIYHNTCLPGDLMKKYASTLKR